jgi:chloramphenicol 3-O phosphotransferase
MSASDADLERRVLGIVRPVVKGAGEEGRLAIVDLRRNGARIDARVHGQGDEAWLVVVWFSDPALTEVESVTVYPRPEQFDGVPSGRVIVLNGPSSVGKSSLMRAFADRARTPFACLDEPFLGRIPPPFLAWRETLGPHVAGFLAAIAEAAALGNQFIVSAAGISQQKFQAALTGVESVYVGLDAPLDVLVRRQLEQIDKFGGLAEESVNIHDGWNYDLRIDTVRHTPEAAARALAEYLAKRYQNTP